MIDILWWLFLIFFAISLICESNCMFAYTHASEKFWMYIGVFCMIAALFCGGLATYITSKTCEDSVVAKAAGISDRCYKGEGK